MSVFLFIGLGNPGEEYQKTRHNVGRLALHAFADELGAAGFDMEKGAKALLSRVKVGKHDVWLAMPETFMNKSGVAVAYLAAKKKVKPENIVVIHDDIDLPIGTTKMVFARGDGGHNGVKSVVRQLKTNEFLRIKIGVSPATAKGVARKPHGEDKIIRFLTGAPIREEEMRIFKKMFRRINGSLELLLTEDRGEAMKECNTA